MSVLPEVTSPDPKRTYRSVLLVNMLLSARRYVILDVSALYAANKQISRVYSEGGGWGEREGGGGGGIEKGGKREKEGE